LRLVVDILGDFDNPRLCFVCFALRYILLLLCLSYYCVCVISLYFCSV